MFSRTYYCAFSCLFICHKTYQTFERCVATNKLALGEIESVNRLTNDNNDEIGQINNSQIF